MDAIVDGAGGDIVKSAVKLLRDNGVIVSYGMTVGPTMPFTMKALVRNIQLMGTTMGSRKDFNDMVEFIRSKRIRPVVSNIVHGLDDLDEIEGIFHMLHKGSQFGKLVLQIREDTKGSRL